MVHIFINPFGLVQLMLKKALVVLGILSKKALTGPIHLELRISSECNLECPACFAKKKSGNMSFSDICNILKSAYNLNVKEIILCGDGEPTLHPDITRIVKEINRFGFQSTIISNGIKLCDLKEPVDKLRLSMWAGDAETYGVVHGCDKKVFNRIIDNVKNLKSTRIIMCNVITNQNYKNIGEMIRLGEKLGAEEVFFSELSERKHNKNLALSPEQKDELHSVAISNRWKIKNNFQSLVSKKGAPCYQGFVSSVIAQNQDVLPCCGSTNSLGNLGKKPLESIWFSDAYHEFRRTQQGYPCNKHCSSLHYNRYLHKSIRFLKWN